MDKSEGRGPFGDHVMSFSAGGNSVSVTIPFTARFTPGAQQTEDGGGESPGSSGIVGKITLYNRADSKNRRTCSFLELLK